MIYLSKNIRVLIIFAFLVTVIIGCKTQKETDVLIENKELKGNDDYDSNITVTRIKSDSIEWAILWKSTILKYTIKYEIIYEGLKRISKDGKNERFRSVLSSASRLARVGHKESENLLLDFYDEYVDIAIEWNEALYDGVDGKPDIFLGPLRGHVFNAFHYIPPSKRKIEIYAKLAGLEKERYLVSEDVAEVLGELIVFKKLRINLKVGPFKNELFELHIQALKSRSEKYEEWLTRTNKELINGMLSGEIEMVDRATWIKRNQ